MVQQKFLEKAEILIEALPYIQRFNRKIIVIKCGGSVMEETELEKSIIEDAVLLKLVGFKPIIVHGGGKEINRWLKRVGKTSKFVNGLRVTDEETLEIAEMALAKVNGELVRFIEGLGVKALGISGKSGHLLRAEKKKSKDDLGFVGDIISVNGSVLNDLIENDFIPVVYPIAIGSGEESYNINADDAASEIAKELNAEKLAFLSDIPGLMRDVKNPESLIAEIYTDEAKQMLKEGSIEGGMIPKIKNCIEAIDAGVKRVHILDGRIPHCLLLELFTDKGIGTAILSETEHKYYKEKDLDMQKKDYKNSDKKYIANTYARYNIVAEKGKNVTLTAENSKEYLDFTSGIGVNSLGYCNEKWVRAVTEQAEKLQHTSNLYYTKPCVDLAEMICERTGMSKVFFGNSGAEGNEGAIKVARKYGSEKHPCKVDIVTLNMSFHGRTITTVKATGQEAMHNFFGPFSRGFIYADVNNIKSLESVVNNNTCAIMLEMIQGEGGIRVLEQEFVDAAVNLCKKYDALLIVDEVQTGVGRTGKLFAYEHFGIKPDIVSFAKGMGGGLPIGGFIMNDKVSGVLGEGDHGSTFGGNPIVAAGGCVVMKTIDEDFLSEITAKGNFIIDELNDMENIYDVSGIGLMIGFKVKNTDSKEFLRKCLDKGLMVLTAKDKVRLLPPLNISKEDISRGLEIIRELQMG